MSRDRRRICPRCQAPLRSSKALVRHLLEEAGEHGVTTSEFLAAGAGPRFGARIHELRHKDGLRIDQAPLPDGGAVYRLAGPLSSSPAGGTRVPPPSPDARPGEQGAAGEQP
ncbi:MAG: hypothetical protein IRZ28_11290, partial [Steroidobacteraceae bacterium]|nr:hypothetical protein [Steroidobacteraceae bacterium]